MIHRSLRSFTVAAVLSAASTAAFAHAHPKIMLPAADSTVSVPAQVSIVFTEGVDPKFSSLMLMDDKGTMASKAASTVDPADSKHMTLALPKLTPGTYTVHWVSVANDGHKATGDYKFTVR